VKYRELTGSGTGETSACVKKRVDRARRIQKMRFGETGTMTNARMTEKQIRACCKIGEDSHQLMEMAIEKLGLSARGMNRVLKVARTIADLDGKEQIETAHVAEAIQYRSLDRSII